MSHYDLPKIDLHLHLDGSVLPETAWELARQQGVPLPADTLEEFRHFIVVTADCRSVNEYLQRFELPLQVLQDKASLARVTRELIGLLASQSAVKRGLLHQDGSPLAVRKGFHDLVLCGQHCNG